ncbi:hypothetical protein B7435_07155 [Mycolicibacterium peregrinum]|uniref:WXG100 family type VII secretion target n=1 Tax=Mycolicibacterium peregrinum TaxID=43304 RepID=UPI000B4B41FD|nr:WXG100 family type VII secretion target [Mycolicibacterium peregrinum]OWM07854.1 hypothetical protein B7435_07155 [Mycolicibacterium peregrinum]
MAGAPSGQVWNFPAVHAAASGITSQSAMIDGLHAEGKATLARLAELWGGSANSAYLELQNRWDTRAAETNQALVSLAKSLHNAADEMQTTESYVQSQFSG